MASVVGLRDEELRTDTGTHTQHEDAWLARQRFWRVLFGGGLSGACRGSSRSVLLRWLDVGLQQNRWSRRRQPAWLTAKAAWPCEPVALC